MKNWKIVWRTITGAIFARDFDNFEEAMGWLEATDIRPISEAVTVWENYHGWKIRHHWSKVLDN